MHLSNWVRSILVVGALGFACKDPVHEACTNGVDDDGDGAQDCADTDCHDAPECAAAAEVCTDGIDNDHDGEADCADTECVGASNCTEVCGNAVDDDHNGLTDCEDPQCLGYDPSCGEVCGDGVDNDGDAAVDCLDYDCFHVSPPCGGLVDGTICAYDGSPGPCQCADGLDNDGDGTIDAADIQCFGPFDDMEDSYATGIPGDNNGANGSRECPFDGNSGPGNDKAVCCNPADPTQNVVPNGCDNQGCCEIDANGNLTGEHVYVSGNCALSTSCDQATRTGCPCTTVADCPSIPRPGGAVAQFCVMDDDTGAGYCSTCEPCVPSAECSNPCDCGETCFGGFTQPVSQCGTCPVGVTACPTGTGCNTDINQQCVDGCCYETCPVGVTPCSVSSDCPTNGFYYCITGCCILSA